MYKYWCDLNIVILRIVSPFKLKSNFLVLKSDMENKNRCIVDIYIIDINDYDNFDFIAKTYREKIMQKGFYIGHHFGERVKIRIVSKNEIYICAKDYDRILWSYIVKYILTIYSIELGYLHVKAGAVQCCGKNLLIVGRGASGKTELIKALCNNGAKYITNTHAVINGNQIKGVNTKIRIRAEDQEFYVNSKDFSDEIDLTEWKNIDSILWMKYRCDDQIHITSISNMDMYYNMRQFSEAIANWELHEDVYDYYDSNLTLISEKLHLIDDKLKQLINGCSCFFVNLDIHKNQSKNEFLRFVERL